MILLDTSGLFAALVRQSAQPRRLPEPLWRQAEPPYCSRRSSSPSSTTSSPGRPASGTELASSARSLSGAYDLVPFLGDDVAAAAGVVESYRDLGIGLADASIVVLAGRFDTDRVLTLDERHFRALRTPQERRSRSSRPTRRAACASSHPAPLIDRSVNGYPPGHGP